MHSPAQHASPRHAPIRVGCAGWSLPRAAWPEFAAAGSHLERYAGRFGAVEINSSFYRPHQQSTYARWADSVPACFRFAVKLPKAITHVQGLRDCHALLDTFFAQVQGLGDKLGNLLVQLPPSLAFDEGVARSFLAALRQRHAGPVALEPRHPDWFTPAADELLALFGTARVLADPVRFDAGRLPGGDPAQVYLRLHGSPRIYHSAYAPSVLDALRVRMERAAAAGTPVWCIFDNTASGAATANALHIVRELARFSSTELKT